MFGGENAFAALQFFNIYGLGPIGTALDLATRGKTPDICSYGSVQVQMRH